MNNALGNTIYTLRKQKGLTQVELGTILSISYQAISKWERGVSVPDTMLLPLIADALDCTIDTLFGHSRK